MSKPTRIIFAIGIILIAGGTFFFVQRAEAPTTPGDGSAGLANPASVNCVQNLHGTLQIADEAGGQVGYCHLPDGRVCEEWSLMRGGCTAPGGTSTATTSQALIGHWRSTEDTSYSLEIAQGGTATERYDGQPAATATSSWQLFTSENPDPTFSGQMQTGVVYLTLADSSGQRHFAIVELSSSTLDMLYLDRGGTLSFTRM